MTRARMPGRHFLAGRWDRDGVATPDIVPPPTIKRLPSCKALPRIEQRPSRERVIAEICVAAAALLLAIACIALLLAARH